MQLSEKPFVFTLRYHSSPERTCESYLRFSILSNRILDRTRRDVVLPLSKPLEGVNGELIHEILVPNNTNVMISIIGANRNPDIWGPDSLEWIPERWLSPLPSSVSDAHVPGIYSHLFVVQVLFFFDYNIIFRRMTFMGGGRACVYVFISFLQDRFTEFSIAASNFRKLR